MLTPVEQTRAAAQDHYGATVRRVVAENDLEAAILGGQSTRDHWYAIRIAALEECVAGLRHERIISALREEAA
jgi:hypothetical protein